MDSHHAGDTQYTSQGHGVFGNGAWSGAHLFFQGIKPRRFDEDELVKSQKAPIIVIPVKTGIQENRLLMDSRFRGSDGLGDFLRDHQ